MKKGDRIVQYPVEYSMCTGCKSCEMLCGLFHDGIASPQRSGIHFVAGPIKTMIHHVYACEHCEDHPCYLACPKKDEAMCVDENGIVYVNREHCIGCGLCVKACTLTPKRVHIAARDGKKFAVKCDLCRGIADGPVCVKNCPAMVLGLKSESADDLSRPAAAAADSGITENLQIAQLKKEKEKGGAQA